MASQTQRMTWAQLAIERAQRDLNKAANHVHQAPLPDRVALGHLRSADKALVEAWSRTRLEAKP